jgi:hypothetical protein
VTYSSNTITMLNNNNVHNNSSSSKILLELSSIVNPNVQPKITNNKKTNNQNKLNTERH